MDGRHSASSTGARAGPKRCPGDDAARGSRSASRRFGKERLRPAPEPNRGSLIQAAKMAKATQQVFAEDMSEEKVDFCLEIATDAFNQASFQGKVYSYVANFIRAAL